MALKRRDACQHAEKNGAFVSCSLYYDADFNEQKTMFRVNVLATDLVGVQSPTDQQVQAVADPKATALYNEWKYRIESASAVTTVHRGQSATVVP